MYRNEYPMYNTSIQVINDFCEAAMLNKKHEPWVKRRTYGKEYAWCIISDKGYVFGDGTGTWFAPYVGIEFFGRLIFYPANWFYGQGEKKVLKEIRVVRLTNTKINDGRSIPADCVTIL
jgi:hypothetical protein